MQDVKKIGQLKGKACLTSGDERSRGVAILFKYGRNVQFHKVETDSQGRFILLECTIFGFDVTLGCVYGPNIDNVGTFENLFSCMTAFKNQCTIL